MDDMEEAEGDEEEEESAEEDEDEGSEAGDEVDNGAKGDAIAPVSDDATDEYVRVWARADIQAGGSAVECSRGAEVAIRLVWTGGLKA